jgi:LPS O-antigen subunit length determinant protein (WzzB/FepE family)
LFFSKTQELSSRVRVRDIRVAEREKEYNISIRDKKQQQAGGREEAQRCRRIKKSTRIADSAGVKKSSTSVSFLGDASTDLKIQRETNG